MRFALIGVDHKTAGIETREKISFTESKLKEILENLKNNSIIDGSVILSTCNRTELYLSYEQNLTKEEIMIIFCNHMGLEQEEGNKCCYIKTDEVAVNYLFELAGGIHSMIFGDDQIAGQINSAVKLANDVNASDSTLNTLFRHAVTSAKKIKSTVKFKEVSPSVATQAVDIMAEYITHNRCKVLVIGNGEIGRNVSNVLESKGCEVYITLRHYHYKQNVIPKGCKTISYEEREKLYEDVDILISATKSPHHTVNYESIYSLENKPKYIMDLALPRDIDPKIGEIEDVDYFNIDSIGENARYDNSEEIKVIKEIIDKQQKKFKDWLTYKTKNQKYILEA